ncbi:MAG: YkgJ family cysteine cluster protein [Desulfobacterales bacterium]|nr:YkgJ family cysteine cluster protein [Desulfobacterales bacterium]
MDNSKSTGVIHPVRYGRKDRFSFMCHKGLSCFTSCCRGINILLTPYDILRLKKRLELSSQEFLSLYTEVNLLEKTDIPVVSLKMLDDEKNSCPFVRDDGCLIYLDRPSTCRYYPLGVVSLSHKEHNQEEDFYFFINESHCRGFEENREWSIEEWRVDQGVDIQDAINAGWTDLIVRKRSFPMNIQLTEKSKQLFFTACYNIDEFKRFVFESSFLTLHQIDEHTITEIQADEISLLQFAFAWLKWILFKDGNFSLDPEAVNRRNATKA